MVTSPFFIRSAMNTYNFDQLINRENTASVKWDLRKKLFNKEDLLPMWVADMDFATPPFIVDAMKKRLEHPLFGYSFRTDSYFESIIQWQKKRHQWDIDPAWISFSPGVVPALSLLVLALTRDLDKIIIQPPVYPPFFDAVRKNGRTMLRNDLIYSDGRYTIDFQDLEAKVLQGANMLILSNPHNPCGRAWTKEELQQIIDICRKNEVIIISDEIHCDLVLPGYKHQPLALVDPTYSENIITAIAPSKTFNIAAMSTSSLIIPNANYRKLYEAMLETIHVGGGNVLGAIASEAAYMHGEEWLDALLVYLSGNVELVKNELADYSDKIQMIQPEATYLVWLDCEGMGLRGNDLHHYFIEKARLGFVRGSDFGDCGSAFARMNIACPRAVLKEALTRLKQVL